ncbi:hypothetical protein SAMN04488109_4151 [Chryseolinea serpens]|uniref:Uncharacterized protein n=1 Tax=Chryseolinea serpens TaxID=947013 RepID=A0A1M5TLN0_9BACT|nr:hypothetical protein SAMN04488109_4151 [Chryseolinea serpens]
MLNFCFDFSERSRGAKLLSQDVRFVSNSVKLDPIHELAKKIALKPVGLIQFNILNSPLFPKKVNTPPI